jgi:hypothetical protein
MRKSADDRVPFAVVTKRQFPALADPAGKPEASMEFGLGAFADPPAMARSSLSQASSRVIQPPASAGVYAFAVKQLLDLPAFLSAAVLKQGKRVLSNFGY